MADPVIFAEQAAAEAAAAAAPTTDQTTPTFEGENKFQHAISMWRNLDLTSLTSKLDNTASEIVTYQRDSTVQRKELAQKTKDFRKLDDESKLSEVKGLLKAYQGFIDVLTNHSKSVNSAFLQAYTSLSEVTDPYPLLEASVDAMLISEDTMPKLTEENKHLQENLAKVTSQLEETEAKLQSERTARKEIEDNLDTRVKEVESSWSAVLEEKKDNWEAKEKSLEEKAENQERLLNEMRASYEVNQRLGKSAGDQDAQRNHVSSAEVEMLHSDLERTSARLAEVEARNEQMRLELAQAKSSASTQHAETSLEADPGYMRMRSENSSLIRKLDNARVEREGVKRELDTKLRSIEREAARLRDEKEALKVKVEKWSDYDEVKQELEVLKSIEFATGDDDEATDKAEAGAKGDTLETMLLGRNKKLSDEMTLLRVSYQELESQLAALQEDLSRTNAELEKSRNLNEKLESDLENMHAEGANAFPSGASVAGTYISRAPPTTTRRGGRSSPTSSIISGLDPRSGPGDREPVGGGSGILPMVTAQRDRFKKRNGELEKELSETHRSVQQLRQEIAALQKDNLNLYEKTRYVSTYNRGGATASSSSTYASNPNPSTVSMGSTSPGPEMDRYRKAYESNLSPFAQFRGRESARAYRRMSIPERAVYSVTRMVLASRTSRNVFAAYCVALHLLVFLTLYWLGSADFEQHATQLGNTAAVAGVAAGAGAGAGGTVGDAPAQHGDWKQDGFQGR
ncbi:Golgi membrane protein [Emericellopsis atlantica]|uniref:Protein CASP n=1 Tax=Emericellopsis atlantica TaxID=2614577 RepID=A0A9P7ZEX6_9HYPO|nr:Golgi membrane protein [Emericellopsis atlantica]KAG9250397.1 Golgi membrane protein [Emericellopsis atlantica]